MNIERIDPRKIKWYNRKLIKEHLERYKFAAQYVSDKIVVDLGCGTGYGSKLLANAGAKKVIGVDVDKKAIDYAKKFFNHPHVSFITSSAQKIDLQDYSADIIVSFETVEHVESPEAFIKEIRRLLKRNGTLIISTPNKVTSFEDNPYHIQEYSCKELQQLLTTFSEKQLYGQRKVILPIIKFYKKLHSLLPNTIRYALHFRPWESYTIAKLKNRSNIPFLYLIAVCKK